MIRRNGSRSAHRVIRHFSAEKNRAFPPVAIEIRLNFRQRGKRNPRRPPRARVFVIPVQRFVRSHGNGVFVNHAAPVFRRSRDPRESHAVRSRKRPDESADLRRFQSERGQSAAVISDRAIFPRHRQPSAFPIRRKTVERRRKRLSAASAEIVRFFFIVFSPESSVFRNSAHRHCHLRARILPPVRTPCTRRTSASDASYCFL